MIGSVIHEVWGDEAELVRVADSGGATGRAANQGQDDGAPASELAAAAGPTVTPAGMGASRRCACFAKFSCRRRVQDDPMNLAYIPSAPTRAAVAFDLVTSAANVFAGVWEAGAGAIYAENEALGWIIELLGWPSSAAGCFVAGGTGGNLSASWRRGMPLWPAAENGRLAAGGWRAPRTCTPHRLAARVLDVGIVEVPENAHGHLTGKAGRRRSRRSRRRVCGRRLGRYDQRWTRRRHGDLADVCDEYECGCTWTAPTAARGSPPRVRRLFDGIERADSFIVDPHKWLFAPYDCCALVYRDVTLARAAHSQHAGYLDAIDREAWNPADLAVHLSRRAGGCRSGSALRCTARIGTSVPSSRPSRQLARWPRRYGPAGTSSASQKPSAPSVRGARLGPGRVRGVVKRTGEGRDPARADELARPHACCGLAFVNPDTQPARVIEALQTLR